MPAAYSFKRLPFAIPPLVEKFARLAFRDIEMHQP
jgi:hypothetical protein